MSLEVANWEEFILGELFDVTYGVNLELNALDETTENDPDGIAFVGRSADNNGVTAYVKPVYGVKPQPKNTITVAGGGSVLSTFVQARDFYSGRDLYCLYEKYQIPYMAKFFIKTVIELEKYRYNYGRQANTSLPSMVIKLPISADGNPDWEWMEKYIKSLPMAEHLPGASSENNFLSVYEYEAKEEKSLKVAEDTIDYQ